MANEVIFQAKLDTTGFANSMKGLQTEMKNLKSQLGNSLLSPEDRNQILLRMGEVKGELQDMKFAINNIDPGDTFGNIATAMRPVVAGFGALTSAAVLFGGENKKMQELQTKIMATIQVTQALQEIADTKRIKALYVMYAESIKGLFIRKATTTATQAETIATEAQAVATQGATIAQQGLNTAMKANPIGAIIAFVAALVTGYMLLKSAFSEDTEETEKNNKAKSDHLKILQDINQEIQDLKIERKVATGEITKEQGEYDKLNSKVIDYAKQIGILQTIQEKQKEAGYEGTKSYKERQNRLELLIAEYTKLSYELGNLSITTQKNTKDEKTAYEKLEEKLSGLQSSYRNQLLLKDKNAEKTAIEIKTTQALIKSIKDQEELLNKAPEKGKTLGVGDQLEKQVKDNQKKIFDAGVKTRETFTEGFKPPEQSGNDIVAGLLGASEEDIQKALEELKTMALDTLGSIMSNSIASNYQSQIDEMNTAIEEGYKKESDLLEEQKKRGLLTEEQYTKKKEQLEKKYQEQQRQAKIREWKLNQELALKQIAINTAVAVSKHLAATGGIDWVGVGLVIASGIAQAAIVNSQKMPKFKTGGLVGGELHSNGGTILEAERGEFVMNRIATSSNLPTLQALNGQNNDLLTSLNQKLDTLIEVSARPTKAYVLEAEITKTQNNIKRIEANASF